jgi:Homeodomain-like domain
MRKGVEVRLGPGDREWLEAVIGSGNSPQKHVWRARIVLLSADGIGTMAIQRQTGKGKPTIWRWQARFMAEGVKACGEYRRVGYVGGSALIGAVIRPPGCAMLTLAANSTAAARRCRGPDGRRCGPGRRSAKPADRHRSIWR